MATRTKWLAYAGIAVLAGVIAYTEIAPREADALRISGDPQVIAHLRCVAKSVALQQQVYRLAEAGAPFPDYLNELEDRVNRLYRYVRGLVQSNDPASTIYRTIMIEEEAASNSAVAVDATGYMHDTWAEVQACDTHYNGELTQ